MLEAIVQGSHKDPFSVLGPHLKGQYWEVCTFQPQASSVRVVEQTGTATAVMQRVHSAGLFRAQFPPPLRPYRLELVEPDGKRVIDDPYRFGSLLGDIDQHLIGEGIHFDLHHKLGAHPATLEDIDGVNFSVWAPNASRVSVIGPFNDWDGRRHPMRLHAAVGVWEIFLPGMSEGELYKYEIKDRDGQLLPLKTDPFARRMEPPAGNASIVYQSRYEWNDEDWIKTCRSSVRLDQPMAVYEVHLGSWRRNIEHDNCWLSYTELAQTLVPYVKDMGYTHIEMLPITEHPFDGSWGYQPIGMFAPTWRFGEPDEFKLLVDACHTNGIAVIMDWVPAHFPRDEFGLACFDGTHLYEHADPRRGAHPDWGTLIFNLGRAEVSNYLIANALFWIEEYHIDALRVDAVASLLYLDYSREPGEWVANEFGGNENLEAIRFLRRLNEAAHQRGAVMIAEESTAWPMVSRPTYNGGLGFTYKWNMGWMHDTLGYIAQDPVHRKYHHDRMTFSITYAFSENFILPLSHDEVVHGKGSILARMPGDDWQKFANLRLYFAFMYCHPGKKHMFMGNELGQFAEWDHDKSLDWHLLELEQHAGVQRFVRELNRMYTGTPALFEVDFEHAGFEWIDCDDRDHSVLAFLRRAKDPMQFVVVVCNFTPVVRSHYSIGVPVGGIYNEIFNSDAAEFGGGGKCNMGVVAADDVNPDGYTHLLNLTIPPLATVILQPEPAHD